MMTASCDAPSVRLEHFLDCQSAIDQLFQAAIAKSADVRTAFDDFLDFSRRFSHLSIYNAMLIKVQRPGAVAVGSVAKWKTVGRTIMPGATPLVILWPFGPVQFVYDHVDTEGAPIAGADANCVFAQGTVTAARYQDLAKAASRYGVDTRETYAYGELLAGTAHAITAKRSDDSEGGRRWHVVVNLHHDLPTRFATLAHELGHIYCGHLGPGPKDAWPRRNTLNHHERELEAEAVAWLVCKRNGVTPASEDYLSAHVGSADLAKVSIYAILEAANRIESRKYTRRAARSRLQLSLED